MSNMIEGLKEFGQEWGGLGSIAGAAFGAASFINSMNEMREIRAQLDEILAALSRIEGKVDELLEKTDEILTTLEQFRTEFPGIVRIIVTDVVSVALLESEWTQLRNIRDNFLASGPNHVFTQDAWGRASFAITYIEDHEQRFDKLLRLLSFFELILAISRGTKAKFVELKVFGILSDLSELYKFLGRKVIDNLLMIETRLNNREYVASHNFRREMTDYSKVTISKMPDRTKTSVRNVWSCLGEITHKPNGDNGDCGWVSRPYQVPDTAFSTARDAHIELVKKSIKEVTANLQIMQALFPVIEAYDAYYDSIRDIVAADGDLVTNERVRSKELFERVMEGAKADPGSEAALNDYRDFRPVVSELGFFAQE